MNRFHQCLAVFCALAMMASSAIFAKPIATTPDNILVGRNGMYIKTAEGLLAINSIVETENGCLIAIPKSASEYEDIEWSCPRCGTSNTGDGICSSCGWPLYDDD